MAVVGGIFLMAMRIMAKKPSDNLAMLSIILASILAIGCEVPDRAGADNSTRQQPITMAAYNQLKSGMSYEQAVDVLGRQGVEVSSSDVAGYRTVMYIWTNDGTIGNMNAMFQNGKLVQKAQFGLR